MSTRGRKKFRTEEDVRRQNREKSLRHFYKNKERLNEERMQRYWKNKEHNEKLS